MACYLLHRKHFKCLSIAFTIVFVTSSFSQTQVKNNFTDNEIKAFVFEVFQKNANQLVYNVNPHRLNLITTFLNKKYVVEYRPEYSGKKFELISDLGLNNKYNHNLTLDTYYNPYTFNPLKYKFPMSPKSKKMYRIGSTHYVISINAFN